MARRKKNPLGDFEDALNSLGFGGSEGGESVTDIDAHDTADTVLNDPNDDIDNLDNPDTNTVTEDNKEVEDPNVHEDNTEIPDNILNNTSDNNTVNVNEEETTEDIDDPNAEIPGEAEQIGAFFDAFAEANGWSVADNEKPTNVNELVDYIKDVVSENSVPQYADDRIAQLDQYVKNGGRFEDFYQTQQRTLSYDNINIEDESN
jgi:hypothetical protein